MENLPNRRNSDVLRELLALDGAVILDIGCGPGALVRLMERSGARAIGLENNPAQLDKARAADPVGGESYVAGVGQQLPFASGAFDGAVFFNSLHHIPRDHMDAAISEAARVVGAGGSIAVFEPVAEGPFQELAAPVDDETVVRDLALAAIRRADGGELAMRRELRYVYAHRYTDYEAYREEMVRIDASRQGLFDSQDDAFREAFHRLGRAGDKGYAFDQPMRVNLLIKA